MTKYYKSNYYKEDIEVEEIDWEIFVNITTNDNKKIIYSWYDIKEKTSHSPYIKNAIIASFIWNIPNNILILGFWITWVEIDNAMIEISKNEFQLDNINYFNMWALKAIEILKNNKKNKFDIIFIDVYDENSKIPDFINDNIFWEDLKKLSLEDTKIIINYANNYENSKYYNEIDNKIKNIFKKKYIKILNNKNDDWNIIWVYNLNKNLNSQDLILEYLNKVQNWEINYDSNIISNIFLE